MYSFTDLEPVYCSKVSCEAWETDFWASSKKRSISASLPMPKPLIVWITINCGKFWKRWEYHWPASWDIHMQVKKQQLELNMEEQTGTKSGNRYVKAVYCHLAYLTYLQSTSWEMLDWMKQKLESRLPGEISVISDTQRTLPYCRKQRRTEESLDENERGEWKCWLKTQHSEN